MDAIFLEALVANLRTPLARNSRNDSRLSQSARVNQSQQVQNTAQVHHIRNQAANRAKQLHVCEEKDDTAGYDNEKCCDE